MPYQTVPDSVRRFMDRITELCGAQHAAWAETFNAAFANILDAAAGRPLATTLNRLVPIVKDT